ncbi:MAG: single-stranded-DNA-specific exonuclease RecJ [Oscillospiraceae bacterium]|nr:single-stranded-DNA-specific exonuclease RecJ [Oscillospiraceae bacterium]
MENKKWIQKEIDAQQVEIYKQQYNLSESVATVLAGRHAQIDNGDILLEKAGLEAFHDPYLMKDMGKAVERINKAIEAKEKITIYGDFDCDGVTSTAILYLYLKSRGANVAFYIPDRIGEGYGVNTAAIDAINEMGTNLIITVDTGITAIDDVNYANSLGLDVIITDHHEPKDEVPSAFAIVDPKQKNCGYPFKHLAGVGVVFKLIQAFGDGDKKIFDDYVSFVCLGTIADVAPLVGENREFVKRGLKAFAKSKNKGIQALGRVCNPNNREVTANMIGFIIAPRINAAGRLGSAFKSIQMFLCDDINRAIDIAWELVDENIKRQQLEAKIYDEVIDIIEKERLHEDKIIVIAQKGWHQGIIGIVSSKITERYYKPSILITLDDEGIGKGSGRGIENFNMFDALTACNDYLVCFGGHALAAGLTIREENISHLRETINKFAKTHLKATDYIPVINIDCKLAPKDLSFDFLNELKILEPFGKDNPQPIFLLKTAKISRLGTMAEKKHMRMTLDFGNAKLDAVMFGKGFMADSFRAGDGVNCVGTLGINEYGGNKQLQFLIKDIRKC